MIQEREALLAELVRAEDEAWAWQRLQELVATQPNELEYHEKVWSPRAAYRWWRWLSCCLSLVAVAIGLPIVLPIAGGYRWCPSCP